MAAGVSNVNAYVYRDDDISTPTTVSCRHSWTSSPLSCAAARIQLIPAYFAIQRHLVMHFLPLRRDHQLPAILPLYAWSIIIYRRLILQWNDWSNSTLSFRFVPHCIHKFRLNIHDFLVVLKFAIKNNFFFVISVFLVHLTFVRPPHILTPYVRTTGNTHSLY